MPICYPRLVQTGLHQTDFPTLCWFETDRLRMGGVVRHTQHTFRNTAFGIPGLRWLWRMGRPLIPAEADIPTHIWEWRNRCLLTPYTAWTPIEIPVYYPYESVDIWCRSRPGEKENYPYMHDKIRDPGERYPWAGPYGGLAACGSDEPSERPDCDSLRVPQFAMVSLPGRIRIRRCSFDRQASSAPAGARRDRPRPDRVHPNGDAGLLCTDGFHASAQPHCHRCAWNCGCDSAARGLRLRRNGPGGAGCPLQRNER